ncbi:MAG TPA: hypothetical protein VFF65_12605, partial [Phycisphaerales bacterium]|nr:hypothetical protein [Phycisphaerales bacterium]
PGIGNIPAILIRPCFPPGSDPTVIPTGPAAPYTPWSPWKFPPSWVPNVPPPAGPYPCGRIPGKIKWNPTRPGWDFVTPGMPPIPLSSTVTSTPIGGTPANATPVNIGGAPGTLTPGDGSISGD